MTNLLTNLPKLEVTPQVFKRLPEGAGIYVYFKNSYPIYIGKAINLKRRVSSYFDLDLEVKTAKMMSETTKLSYIRVDSELEALLLEARLIRAYLPKYNIISKDDKHPLYIQITKEKYPKVITVRKIDLNKGPTLAVYGPFPSSGNVRSVLRMIRRIFPYSDHKIGKRPCLYSHIGLCNPCPNEIEQIVNSEKQMVLRKQYLRNLGHIKSILDGRINKVMTGLNRKMTEASNAQNFEEAAEIRNKIQRLEYITRPQMPTDYYIENPNLYEDTKKSELREVKNIINQGYSTWKVESLHRIECYDIAHLAGTNATASMVTFTDGEADKNLYRHFKIRQIKGNSDIDSMKEVIMRRIRHLNDWGVPDLIIVDGGTFQVNAFASTLIANKIEIPVVGIAKNPDRLIVGDQKIKLQVFDPEAQTRRGAVNLIQRIRDEAHRFARVYHHKLVSANMLN
jgi:excinuclease ABC subunit C